MTPLADLVAYHRERDRHCRDEINRAADFKDERLSKRAVKIWTEERRIARDTAAWLETLKSRTEV